MPRPSSAPNAAERAAANVKQIVGENIKVHRITLGLSQEELAEKFGVSRAALSQYEIGAGEVNAGDLPRLADILGISTIHFFSRPIKDYIPPTDQRTGWMRDQLPPNLGANETQPIMPFDPKRFGSGAENERGIPFNLWGGESSEEDLAVREMLMQFQELPASDQDLVRKMVTALHSKSSSRPSAGTAKARRRVSKKRISQAPASQVLDPVTNT